MLTTPQSPWQNPYAERLIGSIRRERLAHIIEQSKMLRQQVELKSVDVTYSLRYLGCT